MPPQQAVARPVRFAQMLSSGAGARRVAIVAASAVGKLQLQLQLQLQLRRLAGANAENMMLNTVDQAMNWLAPDMNSL